jgi:pyruvate dehydrogenase E2 component (dihydrolipoamide acetyltransferase)
MSRYEFKLPDIGEGVTEGEIVRWLVRPGEAIGEDQPMVEVMTDKATVTITSPKTGRVLEVAGDAGAVVQVHATLVVLDLGNGADADARAKDDGPAASAVGDIREDLPGMALAVGTSTPQSTPFRAAGNGDGYYQDKPLATPATRQLARELGLDLRRVPPTGPSGRVLKEDVRAASARAAGMADVRDAAGALAPASPGVREKRIPLRGMRKRIFETMARSKHTAAHFTFVEECEVGALRALRDRLAPLAAEQGVKLTYLSFFVKALVAALKRHPALNAAYDERAGEIVERYYYNVGIASATAEGLMVPVVKDAGHKSLLDIARDIARLAELSKAGRIPAEDLRGSTFTITSLGKQGGLLATPILNPPEVGILGLHRIKERPVVRDGAIVVGEVMLVSLSFDHRLIDGHVGAAFAYELLSYVERPERLWLEMV